MTGPTAHAPPAPGSVSTAPAAWGVLPGAPPPQPAPGLQGVISEAPTHSSRQTSGVCPWAAGQSPRCHACMRDPGQRPRGGRPADSQTPHPTFCAGWHPSGSGSDCSPTPKRLPLPQCTPLLLAKGPTRAPPLETCIGCPFPSALPLPPSTHFCVFQL
ncbi:hypothetical protein HJG60_012067 [Phyllostomus discolor]|uniref:Uncharacterized protein n=1 Tax=Phyllostomus discolor TaxID=89673 RepID=A0A834DT44_9CHIR|nr:hypothetical protein HJG60_012067 [Phyllostomus discolor]